MPPSKPKPSEIAVEAKKSYIPYIRTNFSAQWPSTSYMCHSESVRSPQGNAALRDNPRFAFYDRDPVDLALDWSDPSDAQQTPPLKPVVVIMPANEKRPGGDWEAGVMSPEECLCRRSNLFATLTTPAEGNCAASNYPIPPKAGIYSGTVVVFRDGPEKYQTWQEYKALPVISVCPVKRPKLDSSGKKYSFKQEKELMREKIYTALRIAKYNGHTRLCIGTFGLGPGFRNPPEEVAIMWRDALLKDPEFVGSFQDVVFSFEAPEGAVAVSSSSSTSRHSSSKSSSKSSSSSSASKSSVAADLEIFQHVFKPAVIHGTTPQGLQPSPQLMTPDYSPSSSASGY